jgi:ATP-dependent exoDNAse (exonuclease V) beta subunit
MVFFNKEQHSYTNSEGEKYISVTTLLSEYKNKFDTEKHATRVALKEGVTKEFVIQLWEDITKTATDKGTEIHKALEDYITKVEATCDKHRDLCRSYDDIVYNNIDKHTEVLSEKLLYNDEYKVAGTADLIYDHDKYFTIGDFKTNKKFNFSSKYNEYFNEPLSHLNYSEFNSYALQLSLYAFMYEKLSGKRCRKIVIFYLEQDKFIPIHCNYLKSDIINLLKHYKYIKK